MLSRHVALQMSFPTRDKDPGYKGLYLYTKVLKNWDYLFTVLLLFERNLEFEDLFYWFIDFLKLIFCDFLIISTDFY